MKIGIAFSGLALVACAGASAAPTVSAPISGPTGTQRYAIHVQRPSKVGDRWHVISDDESSERTSALVAHTTTPVDASKTTRVHLDGTVVVLELQDNGRSPLRDETTVNELWTTLESGAKQALAPPGAHVTVGRAAKKEDATVTVDGLPASQAVRDAIDSLFPLTTYTGPSDDDVFGSAVPQGIGGEWGINQPLAEKSLAASGIIVSPGTMTGTTKLVGLQSMDGINCLQLENRMTVGALQSIASLPGGSTIQSSRADVELHLLVPADDVQTAARSEMTMTLAGKFTIPSPKGPVQVTLESVKHASLVRQTVGRAP